MRRFTSYVLLFSAGACFVVSLVTLIPGYLSIDEITYHLMAKNFSASGGFEIWNGYRESPSAELIPLHLAVTVSDGGLVPQPPYLINLLGAVFYRIRGVTGLFLLNMLAFAGTAVLCYKIAQNLFNDCHLAFRACLIFALATFSYEYSQAIWFHATTTFAITAAFYLFLCAFSAPALRAAWLFALMSGVITGFAAGIRPDVILAVPGLVLPFLFLRKPWRPGLALAVCLGTMPGLLALSITNDIKFGIFFPFSYGGTQFLEGTYGLPFAGFALVVVLILWAAKRYSETLWADLLRYRRPVILMIAVSVVALVMIPLVRQTVVKHLHIAYQIIVDLRVHDLHILQPAQLRTQSGGMIYIGGLKKSLLQSCPYLVIVMIPFLHIIRRTRTGRALALLFVIPVVFIGFYAFSPNPATSEAWHGGLCLNLRYLLPIFPFTSILAASAWRELTRELPPGRWERLLIVLFLVTTCSYFFIVRLAFNTSEEQEFVYLTLPLILASVLALLLIVRGINMTRTEAQRQIVLSLTVVALFIALVWAGLVEFFYDYPLVRRTRKFNRDVAADAAGILASDSLLFSTFVDPFFAVIEQKRIRIANPLRDNFQDFAALTTFHLQHGRAVYAAFHVRDWNWLKNSGPLAPDEFRIRRCHIFSHTVLCQILSKTPNDSDS